MVKVLHGAEAVFPDTGKEGSKNVKTLASDL
jgi:hypothetical protein